MINTFMLENFSQLANFVGQMTRINRGLNSWSGTENLGKYVLVD